MKRKHTTKISIVIIFTLLFFTGCETYNNFRAAFWDIEEDSDAVIRIGVFQPLSGQHQRNGELERRGIELAHELFPSVFGINVELIFADNQSNLYVAETAIQTLIGRNPAIVLGSYGEIYSLIAAAFLEEAGIPAITATNTNWLVTSSNPYYFRIRFVYSFEGTAVARFAVEDLNASSAAIFKPANDDSAIAVSQAFWDGMADFTGNEDVVVSSQDFDSNDYDFREQLRIIRNSGADVVFMPSSIEDAAEILIQAREVGVTATFLGIHNWENPELIERAGAAAEGVAFSSIFDPETDVTEMTEVFLRAYREKYGEDAIPAVEVALAFDAYLVAIDAIRRAGTWLYGGRIKRALADTHDFQGASGSITFDERGDPIKSVVIKTVRNGEIVATYIVEPTFDDDEDEEYDDGV